MSVALIYPCTIQLLSMVRGMGFIVQKIPLILYGFPLNYVLFFFLEQFREGTCIEEPLNSLPFEFMSAPTPFGDVLS